ncbi:MAG: hypothetical protein LBP58_06840 [Azoarcus sp.]|nr:hypothetical protein [Azoarcus sp.]
MSNERKNVDWAAIEGEYLAGIDSVNAIANKHGIAEGTIRARAKKNGWSRDPAGTKRQIVAAAMAGVTSQITNDVIRNIEDAAAADIDDMNRALRIQRQCLVRLEAALQAVTDPKEIRIIANATNEAMESIRGIRGLDAPVTVTSRELEGDALIEELRRRGLPTDVLEE